MMTTAASFGLLPVSEDYQELSASSRVWIYQTKQPIPEDFIPEIKVAVWRFARQWVSHNRRLKAFADVLHRRFIVLMVDEAQADASGCSIDASVHFLQQLEHAFSLDLFDRLTFTWFEGGEIKAADRDTFARLYRQGLIADQTLVFDNLVQTKAAFEKNWLKPLHQSWHKRLLEA